MIEIQKPSKESNSYFDADDYEKSKLSDDEVKILLDNNPELKRNGYAYIDNHYVFTEER